MPNAGDAPAPRGDAARLQRAFEAFAAGDPEPLDALRAPGFLHTGNPLFHRDGEPARFASMTERLASFDAHGVSATARLIALERVSDGVFVATTALHTEARQGSGISMLAGVLVSFDAEGRIDHIHTYDTPELARSAAAEGCCEAHRRNLAAAQATP